MEIKKNKQRKREVKQWVSETTIESIKELLKESKADQTCYKCKKFYRTPHRLRSHVKSHYTIYICPCGLVASVQDNLYRHFRFGSCTAYPVPTLADCFETDAENYQEVHSKFCTLSPKDFPSVLPIPQVDKEESKDGPKAPVSKKRKLGEISDQQTKASKQADVTQSESTLQIDSVLRVKHADRPNGTETATNEDTDKDNSVNIKPSTGANFNHVMEHENSSSVRSSSWCTVELEDIGGDVRMKQIDVLKEKIKSTENFITELKSLTADLEEDAKELRLKLAQLILNTLTRSVQK